MRRAWRASRAAVAFLTILPIRFTPREPDPSDLAASRFAYPLVGAAMGLILALISLGLDRLHCPNSVAAFLLLAAGTLVTGGLHLDGLADTADGLFLPAEPQRRLDVMRDPHIGAFGAIAIVLLLIGKFAVLTSFTSTRQRALALFMAALAGRCAIILAAGVSSYPRPDGTGRILVEATGPKDAVWALLVVILVSGVLGGMAGLRVTLSTAIVAFLIAALARRRLGGVTGDVLGAVCELSELAALAALSR
jgi:adenosylcobinamide-GDP ribazoletransferase